MWLFYMLFGFLHIIAMWLIMMWILKNLTCWTVSLPIEFQTKLQQGYLFQLLEKQLECLGVILSPTNTSDIWL